MNDNEKEKPRRPIPGESNPRPNVEMPKINDSLNIDNTKKRINS